MERTTNLKKYTFKFAKINGSFFYGYRPFLQVTKWYK